eukprot:scaffold28510_cov56-Attheya_sp.AAC.1
MPLCGMETGSSSGIQAVEKVSGTDIKSATCILGLACGMLEDVCTAELTGLDQCLPLLMDETDLENGESSYECNEVYDECVESSVVSMMMPPELTRGALPDSCVRMSQEKDYFQTRHVMARFDQYNAMCNNIGPLTVSIHNPITTKNMAVTNSQKSSGEEKDSSCPPAILGLVLFVGVYGVMQMAAFVVARNKYKKYTYTESAPRNNFQKVSHEEESMFFSEMS